VEPETMSKEEAGANVEGKMNARQRQVVTDVLAGSNVFFHGAAGTGKSYVLNTLVALLRCKNGPNSVAVTAPTGIAAVGVGGVTVHKFIGAGLCSGRWEQVVGTVMKSKVAVERWKQTETLVIDEISMLDADLLEKMDHVGRATRGNHDVAFGGIQLIVTGDFYQLPPVAVGRGAGDPPFAFASRAWANARMKVIELTEVLRQKDPRLVAALNEVRSGGVARGGAASQLFHSLARPLQVSSAAPGVLPTRLYSTNRNVDAENQGELSKLPGEAVVLEGKDSGDDKGALETLSRNCPVPASLVLKPGAQVVLLRNVDDTLVNGSRGVVTGFVEKNSTEYVRHQHSFRIHPKLARVAETLFKRVPLVTFDNGRVLALNCAEFNAHGGARKYAERLQVPLKLAWALTVHKSQGMTISRLEVSLW
jgi:ATP-dependent DNA helicase PIF1